MLPAKKPHRNSATSSSFGGQRNKRPRLGQILVGAGLVEADTLHGCLRVAKRTHQKLGAVLVDKNVISGADLEAALLAQKYIADGTVTETSSAGILQTVSRQRIDVCTAIKLQSASEIDQACDIPELTELLLGSGMIKARALGDIHSLAVTSGMSLCKTLLIANALSTENLDAILIMIVLIRNGSLRMQDAIRAVRDLRYNHIEVTRDSLRFPNNSNGYAPLGELLVEGNCLNDFECLFAIESALASNRQLGQMLIQSGLLSESIIDNALLLQKFTACGVICDELAVVALRRIEQEGLSLIEVARQLKLFKDSQHATLSIELLIEGGYLQSEMVQAAIISQSAFEMDPGKALLASGKISRSLMNGAKSCVQDLESGSITLRQAFKLLRETALHDRLMTKSSNAVSEIVERLPQALEVLECSVPRLPVLFETPIKKLHNEVSDYMAYPEFKLLVAYFSVLAGGIFAVLSCVPEDLQWGFLFSALTVTSIVLLQTGHSWTKRSEGKMMVG